MSFVPSQVKPGTYDGIPFDEYLQIPAVSNSKLSGLNRSPAFCLLQQAHTEATPAQVIGTAVHTLVLEPHLFDTQYARRPEVDGRTKAGKEATEAARLRHPDAIWLASKDYDAVHGMAESISTHPDAIPLLKSATCFEQTTVWDRGPGVLCKSRKDLGHPDWVADLKTTRNLMDFQGEFIRHGYYRQAAWYMDGELAVGNAPKAFFFLVVQNTPPFESKVFNVDLYSLDVGREANEKLFAEYIACKNHAEWTRHLTGIGTLTVPNWLMDKTFATEEEDAA